MRLPELIDKLEPELSPSFYQRYKDCTLEELRLLFIIHLSSSYKKEPIESRSSIYLTDEEKIAASVITLDEEESGEIWDISRLAADEGYINSFIKSERLLVDLVLEMARLPEAEVRHLTLQLKNIPGLGDQFTQEDFTVLQQLLQLRYSNEVGRFVRDIKK